MSGYEDLVELGFEGVDRFATKYHDYFADVVGGKIHKNKPKDKHNTRGSAGRERAKERPEGVREGNEDEAYKGPDLSHRWQRDEPIPAPGEHSEGFPPLPQGYGQRPERQRQYPPSMPPAQAWPDPTVPNRGLPPVGPQVPHYSPPRNLDASSQYHSLSRRPRALSEPGDYSSDEDSISDPENRGRNKYETYSAHGRRDGGRKDGMASEMYPRDMGMGGRVTSARRLEAGDFGSETWREPNERRRPRPSRRGSSWSPPRRHSKHDLESPPRRRPRSRSRGYGSIGTVIGALAGGLAGSQVKKGETVPNTAAMIAGAVVGGLGAREAETMMDRHRGQRRSEESWRADKHEEQDDRRGRRRRDREYRYDDWR